MPNDLPAGMLRGSASRSSSASVPNADAPEPRRSSSINDTYQKNQLEEVQKHKYRYARLFVIEFFSYMVFLMVFMVVTYSFRSSWAYWNSELIRDSLFRAAADDGFGPEFSTISSVDGLWDYFETAFLPAFFPETSIFSGKKLDAYDRQFMNSFNYRVGAMRWRQVRIKASNCSIDIAMAGFFKHFKPPAAVNVETEDDDESEETVCYPKISEATLATDPFPVGKDYFKWSSEAELCRGSQFCATRVTGIETENKYASSGYVWDFPNNYSAALADTRFLKENDFLSIATRALIIEFTLFNPGVNIVLSCQMRAEFYPTGQLATHSSVKPMPLMTLELAEQIMEFIGECVLAIFIFGYIVREFQEFLRHYRIGSRYCTRWAALHSHSVMGAHLLLGPTGG